MSRFQAVMEDSYPDLIRALALAAELIEKRPAILEEPDVIAALCASDDEAARLTAALRAGFQDLRMAVEEYVAKREGASVLLEPARLEGAELGAHVMIALIRAAQLGCWLGQSRLMSLKDKDLKARLAQLEAAARKKH